MIKNKVRNILLLSLLSIQVGINPIMMKWYAKETSSVALKVMVIEIMKVVVAVSMLISQGEFITEMKNWSFSLAIKTTLLPSIIYLVQNYLNQTAVVILDGVTFNILNQTKIIWTAIMVRQDVYKRVLVFQTLHCAKVFNFFYMILGVCDAGKTSIKNADTISCASVCWWCDYH